MRYILQITITKLMKNITTIMIILLIAAIQQIVKAQNINVTVLVITVNQSLTTNSFNDANAINTLVAELVTITISTIVITIIICIKKRNTKILKQQINCLATSQTSRPPDYQGYP